MPDILPLLRQTSLEEEAISFLQDISFLLHFKLEFTVQTEDQLIAEMTHPFTPTLGSPICSNDIGFQTLLDET